jgi:hypothetical protein
MSKPKVTTARIVRLYKEHKNIAEVARRVKRHLTTVRDRLIRAGVIDGEIYVSK